MRLQRALARAGVVSRRAAEALIADGRVTVNGTVARTGQPVVIGRDRVLIDGKAVDLKEPPRRWLVLNKPAGVVTTKRDPEGRETIFDFVKDPAGLTYVGRLDYLTEGVILLTNDGDSAHRLTHPSFGVERTYEATVRGSVKQAAEQARDGIELEDGVVVPTGVQVRPLGQRRWIFELTLREGKNREVRRICEALGLDIERLVRTRYGPIALGQLATGKSRALTEREQFLLQDLVQGKATPR